MAVAEIEEARATFEAARQQAKARRLELAALLAFGARVDQGELLQLLAASGADAEIEREVERWRGIRSAWAGCSALPSLEEELAEAHLRYQAGVAAIERELAALPIGTPMEERNRLRHERTAGLLRPAELVEAHSRATQAWARLVDLLPRERQEAERGRLARLAVAATRVQRARRLVEEADARPVVQRIKDRLAQIARNVGEMTREALPQLPRTYDAALLGEIHHRRTVEVEARGAAFSGLEASRARLERELREAESPARAQRFANAREELAAAEAHQAELLAQPSLWTQVRDEIADLETRASAPAKAKRGR